MLDKIREFSMKTWIIIGASIIAIMILIVIIRPKSKDGDLSLTTYDGTTTLTFTEIVERDLTKAGTNQARCTVKSGIKFFENYVSGSPYYVGSVDGDRNLIPPLENRDTGRYLFLKDNRYFDVTYSGGQVAITELTSTIKSGDVVMYYMIFPCNWSFSFDVVGKMDLASLVTVSDFDTLREFYERLGTGYATVDVNDQSVTVNLIQKGEVSDQQAKVRMVDYGLEVTILPRTLSE